MRNADAVSIFYVGKFRIVFCIGSGNVEIGETGADLHFKVIVHRYVDRPLRQAADDIKEADIQEQGACMSASMETVIAVSKLYPVSCKFRLARQ